MLSPKVAKSIVAGLIAACGLMGTMMSVSSHYSWRNPFHKPTVAAQEPPLVEPVPVVNHVDEEIAPIPQATQTIVVPIVFPVTVEAPKPEPTPTGPVVLESNPPQYGTMYSDDSVRDKSFEPPKMLAGPLQELPIDESKAVLANTAAVLKEASPPEPVSPTAEQLKALVIKITAPPSIVENNFVHVYIEVEGNVREWDVEIEPPPKDGNLNFDDPDRPMHVIFTGKPRVYTIHVVAIHDIKGRTKQEARTIILAEEPLTPVVQETGPIDPKILIPRWMKEVPTNNKGPEALEIAEAAQTVAELVRKNDKMLPNAGEMWVAESYRRLSSAQRNWNINPAGLSFFDHMSDTIADYLAAAKKEGIQPDLPKFLENLAEIIKAGAVEE